MPRRRMRRSGRADYMRDRAERRGRRSGDRRDRYYPMDYARGDSERGSRSSSRGGRDRYPMEDYYMEYQQPRERYGDYGYDMRGDYRRGGRGRDRGDYADYRDYAEEEDEEYDKEYHEDLMEWVKDLKKDDRYKLPKEEIVKKAEDMGVKFDEFDEDEFYAIYLMHVSDYPFIANEPHTYLAMAKAWLEDKDLEIDPSEKVCKYMYEIVMAEE